MPTTGSAVSSGTPSQSASAIVASTESGQHLLKIDGYSLTKDVPNGSHIRSRSFRAGGHDWHIRYYPNGFNPFFDEYISIYLQLDHKVDDGVRAWYTFNVLDRAGKPVPAYTSSSDEARVFRSADWGWGFTTFIKRDVLEKSESLWDDCFTITCDFKIVRAIRTEELGVATPKPPSAPPTSNLHRHLGGLLAAGDGADVTFIVDGKSFAAHRCVLAARSSVFREELFGPAKESAAATNATTIRIDDMEAQDFEALLCFVYSDSLPEMKQEEEAAMLPDLIAAANRYDMDRLRLICEDKLCRYVDVSTVAAILAFAEQHHCHGLKETCLEFLFHPANLRAVLASDSLECLIKTYPSVLKELAKLAKAL